MTLFKRIFKYFIVWFCGPYCLLEIIKFFGCALANYPKITAASEFQIDGGLVNKKLAKIVGGESCDSKQYPFYITIWVLGKGLLCGGSLVTSEWILSAANCFQKNVPLGSYTIIAGINTYSNSLPNDAQASKLSKIEYHPYYFEYPEHDIAMAKLSQPFKKTDKVSFVNLERGVHSYPPCSKGIVMGFGTQNIMEGFGNKTLFEIEKEYNPKLQCVELTVIDVYKCRTYYKAQESFPRGFCATDPQGGKDACVGDSGSPFVCKGQQIGLASRAKSCGKKGVAAVYTRIYTFINFIDNITGIDPDSLSQNLMLSNKWTNNVNTSWTDERSAGFKMYTTHTLHLLFAIMIILFTIHM